MTAKERIGTIRLLERIERQSEYAKIIGVEGRIKIERKDQTPANVKER